MSIEDAVSELYERFSDSDGVSMYDIDDNYLCDAMESLLAKYVEQGDITDFIVDADTLFESCGYDTGYVNAIWVTPDGKAHQDMRQWERY